MARSLKARRRRTLVIGCLLAAIPAVVHVSQADRSTPPRPTGFGQETLLHDAARRGDLAALQERLDEGVAPDARDPDGRTALLEAVTANQVDAMRLLLASHAGVNVASPSGETPLIEAVRTGNLDAARLLIAAGADLDRRSRGLGTALEAAERLGRTDLAALLRRAGARTFGRSVGDSVCVRPWSGEGFCGQVEGLDGNIYRIRLTTIVGCSRGCDAKPDCSAGLSVGGAHGLRADDLVETPSWCVTDTDVGP